MIELYSWTTPNGHKITIFLEETGLAYTLKTVNISKGEQFHPDFLRISPNNKMPALVDPAPASGAGPVAEWTPVPAGTLWLVRQGELRARVGDHA